MATIKPKFNLGGLARRLISDQLLSEQQANETYEQALKKRIPYVSHLVENKILKPMQIAVSASLEFGANPFFAPGPIGS